VEIEQDNSKVTTSYQHIHSN